MGMIYYELKMKFGFNWLFHYQKIKYDALNSDEKVGWISIKRQNSKFKEAMHLFHMHEKEKK